MKLLDHYNMFLTKNLLNLFTRISSYIVTYKIDALVKHIVNILSCILCVMLLIFSFSNYRFVDCDECGRKLHKICVLHFEPIWNNG